MEARGSAAVTPTRDIFSHRIEQLGDLILFRDFNRVVEGDGFETEDLLEVLSHHIPVVDDPRRRFSGEDIADCSDN